MNDATLGKFGAVLRTVLRFAIILAIAYGVHLLMEWVLLKAETMAPGSQAFMLTSLVALMLLAYAVLISIPFVPGIEIGLSLMVLRGYPVAPYVFTATFSGLALAYFAGRYLPYSWLQKTLSDLRLTRPSQFLETLQAMPPERRIDLLCQIMPDWLGPHLMRWRYVVLAVLINVPGNSLIGGGGGISLVAGLSRVFSPLATLLTFALAVMPFPLFVWVFKIELITP